MLQLYKIVFQDGLHLCIKKVIYKTFLLLFFGVFLLYGEILSLFCLFVPPCHLTGRNNNRINKVLHKPTPAGRAASGCLAGIYTYNRAG